MSDAPLSIGCLHSWNIGTGAVSAVLSYLTVTYLIHLDQRAPPEMGNPDLFLGSVCACLFIATTLFAFVIILKPSK